MAILLVDHDEPIRLRDGGGASSTASTSANTAAQHRFQRKRRAGEHEEARAS